jgi:hypothetical protein
MDMTVVRPERLGDVSQRVADFEGELADAIRTNVFNGSRPSPESGEGAERVNNVIRRVAGTSFDEIDRVIRHLEQMRETLRREGERVQREVAGYGDLSQAATSSLKVINESLAHWNRPELPQAS